MLAIHMRLAELFAVNKTRELNNDEQTEVAQCLQINYKFACELAEQYNFASIASMIDDMDWLHEICMEIDKLEIAYKTKRPESKNPGQK